MSRSRDKGNRLERAVMPILLDADGPDPVAEGMMTATGRVGNAYHLEVDGITRRFAIECKNQQSLADRLWTWLAHIPAEKLGKVPVLVLKKNYQPPVVQLYLSDFARLVRQTRELP